MTSFPLFDFVGPAHPFRPALDRFAAALASSAECRALVGPAAPRRRTIHAEIKALPVAGGGFRLERFYWSGQCWEGPAARPFRAHTLEFSAKTGQLTWLHFPHDSYLTTMADYFAGEHETAEVLRYVPLRRFTFRSGRRIGKFKRASRFRAAYAQLATVARELRALAADFAVAAPLEIDAARCLYFQEALPGQDLAALIDDATLSPLLSRLGELHAGMHALPVCGVPEWDGAAFLAELERDLRWIAFIRADLSDEMQAVAATLRAQRPVLAASAFCHGDFVCSQVLVADSGWAVTDFDLCCRGDPCRDMAMFLASLGYDVLWLERAAHAGAGEAALAAARAAYLEGYAARAGRRPNRRRLAWHLAAAEIYYLALMLKKDRHSPAAFGAGLDRMRAALTEIA